MESMSAYRLSDLPRIAGLAIAYALLAKISLTLFGNNGLVSVVWPSSGVALAALLIGGRKYWLGVFIGALAGYLLANAAVYPSIWIATGYTLEPLACACLLTRTQRFGYSLSTLQDWLYLSCAAAIGAAINSLVGTVALWYAGQQDATLNFLNFWQGDTFGIILVTPLLLVWQQTPQGWFERSKILETFAFIATTFLAGQIIFLGWFHDIFTHAKGFVMFVFIVWGAVSFGRHGVMLAISLMTLQALTGVYKGIGYFGADFAETHLLNFWLFMYQMALIGMGLALTIQQRMQAFDALKESKFFFKESQRVASIGSYKANLSADYWASSEVLNQIFGIDSSYMKNIRSWLDIVHPSDRRVMDRYLREEIISKRKPFDKEYRIIRKSDGEIRWVHGLGEIISDAGGEIILMGTIQDITSRKQTEDELRIAATTFNAHEAILITDVKANIIRSNSAFTEITGYSAEEVQGKNPRIMQSGKHDRSFYIKMWGQILRSGSWAGEIWDRRKNGTIYPKWITITAVKNELQKTTHYVAIFTDITVRKQVEEEIHNLAFYDVLTGLPNRRLFLDRLNTILLASARHDDYGAILFIDLDHFKTLNDTRGHEYGDLLLKEVGARIQACLREMDTVARFGGDEFVVLLEAISKERDEATRKAALVAEKIRAFLDQPFQLKEHEHRSSPSIGISLYHGNKEPVNTLVEQADKAMYQAKSCGRNTVRFFDAAMQANVANYKALKHDLHHAIALQQLHLYYQVQVDNESRPLGAEAFLRWFHPTRGLVMPNEFLPIAKDNSLILDIGSWVKQTACQQLALWSNHKKTRNLTLAINISAKQFVQPDFITRVAAALEKYQADPSRLRMELSEEVVLTDVGFMIDKINALRNLGVKLSMDNFSTIYSSLSYLKQLSSDHIKIKHDIMQGITEENTDARSLVQTIVNLAKILDMPVFAEGVETEAQLSFLRDLNCMAYQGYLFSKPVAIDEFEALLGV